MADESQRNPGPVPPDASIPPIPQPGTRDANGFDPTAFEWRPVPRRPRKDGWTPEVQQSFLEALMRTGVVERACEAVNMSVSSAYALRNAPGGEGFARAWREVLVRAADRMLDIAFEHAIEGEEVPVFDRDGIRVGAKRRVNTRLMMFMLKAYFPERFRNADKAVIAPSEQLPPAAIPAPDAVGLAAPVLPEAPHLLETPARLDQMVDAEGARLDREERCQPAEQPYRHRRVEEDHPHVVARSRRNKALRAEREERQDEVLGLNLASTSDDHEPIDDPLRDYTYWAPAEEKRLADMDKEADNEDDDGPDDDDDGDRAST